MNNPGAAGPVRHRADSPNPLNDDDVPGCCSPHGIRRNRSVKRDESAFMMHRKSQEVDVGELARPVDPIQTNRLRVEQADGVGPKLMRR